MASQSSQRSEEAARALWVALRNLSDQVEMAESTGICLPDRVSALVARDTLAEYNDVVMRSRLIEYLPDGSVRIRECPYEHSVGVCPCGWTP